jgi:hypothetical protein
MTDTFVPLSAVGRNGHGFFELAEGNPCDGCSAPCCRMVLSPHPTPRRFADLDYIRYLLGFPDSEMVVSRDGTWQHLMHKACGLLDLAQSRCSVHNTPRKPKICVAFDPYKCWYKRNFTVADPPDIVRLDISRFEMMLTACLFDDNGALIEVPSWEQLRALVPPPAVAAGATPANAMAG